MKLLNFLLKLNRKGQNRVNLIGHQEDLLNKIGRQQFKKLLEMGLQIPIVAL
jgi:hypothetical protein